MTRLATPVPSIRKSWFGALPPGHTVVTLAARPDLEPAFDEIGRSEWPEFLERDDVVKRFSQTLLERFPEFQLLLLDAMGAPVAAARSAPFAWNGSVSGCPRVGMTFSRCASRTTNPASEPAPLVPRRCRWTRQDVAGASLA